MDGFDSWLKSRVPDEGLPEGRLLPGTVVGAYHIDAFLGHGGFADVYRAKDETGGDVAIKILHRLDENSRLRFERESRILARIRHRNLPRFLGFGTCGARPYIATELLTACELPHGDRAVARFLTAVMSAVEELHRNGFVHRDIKPANVLARANGEPVLIDFGLAVPISEIEREQSALSYEGERKVAVGTVGFSAPEQFVGEMAGPATDVHALGALVNACFGEKMPRAWKRIYMTATNSNPSMRYQTVAALRHAIALRHAGRWAALAVGAVALAAVGYLVHAELKTSREEERPSQRYLKREQPANVDPAEAQRRREEFLKSLKTKRKDNT